MVVVKLELNGDIRRVTLNEKEQTYANLVAIVKQVFAQDLPDNWVIKYKDEDGDFISVTCDLEFAEAMHLAAKTILKLFVVPKEKKVQPKSSDVKHPAICDHCDQGIVGIRYKCSVCPDYDLCETCEALGNVHDKGHCFLKIPNTFEAMSLRRPCRRLGRNAEPGSASRCPYMAQRCSQPCGQQQQRYYSRFVKDVTVDDGSHFAPGTKFVKVWRLVNNGNTAWPQGTTLRFLTGETLSSVTSVPVPPVAAGEEIDISVDMVAPKKAGQAVSHWRLCTPEGTQFGHRVWADIIVDEESEQPAVVEAPKETVEVKVEVKLPEQPRVEVKLPEQPKVEVKAVKVKKVDDDVPQGPFRSMLIELYDMGFTNLAQNRQVLVRRKGDLVAAVHDLLNM